MLDSMRPDAIKTEPLTSEIIDLGNPEELE
jgi:hypothetical protein